MLKPIETQYNGYRFRSRLEARWAVFSDALGLPYQYEPEGFDLGGGVGYLPDFWVPDWRSWVEIKPYKPTSTDIARYRRFQPQGQRFLVLYGDVYDACYGVWLRDIATHYERWDDQVVLHRCGQCRDGWYLGPNAYDAPMFGLQPCSRMPGCTRTTIPGVAIERAYRAARSARFEHGETPRILPSRPIQQGGRRCACGRGFIRIATGVCLQCEEVAEWRRNNKEYEGWDDPALREDLEKVQCEECHGHLWMNDGVSFNELDIFLNEAEELGIDLTRGSLLDCISWVHGAGGRCYDCEAQAAIMERESKR